MLFISKMKLLCKTYGNSCKGGYHKLGKAFFDTGLLADMFTLVTLPHSCSVFTRTTGLSIIVPNNIIFTRGFINLKTTFNYL